MEIECKIDSWHEVSSRWSCLKEVIYELYRKFEKEDERKSKEDIKIIDQVIKFLEKKYDIKVKYVYY